MDIICVFIGGSIGALLRYLISNIFVGFPLSVVGVFVSNMLGCFLFGMVTYFALKRNNLMNDTVKKFFTVGLAGGLTTFSTFIVDIFKLFSTHHYILLAVYLFVSLIAGLFFITWGMNFAFYVIKRFLIYRKSIRRVTEKL